MGKLVEANESLDTYTYLCQTRIWICNPIQRARNHYQRQVSHTDVNYLALSVDHNIPVVSISDLKDVANDGVRSRRLNEAQSGLLESDRMFSTTVFNEEIERVIDFCQSHLISRC